MATSKELLNKVYNHLDTLDVTTMSMDELKDFLEVVQKGQFLESFGQNPYFGNGGCGFAPFNGFPSNIAENGDDGTGEKPVSVE